MTRLAVTVGCPTVIATRDLCAERRGKITLEGLDLAVLEALLEIWKSSPEGRGRRCENRLRWARAEESRREGIDADGFPGPDEAMAAMTIALNPRWTDRAPTNWRRWRLSAAHEKLMGAFPNLHRAELAEGVLGRGEWPWTATLTS